MKTLFPFDLKKCWKRARGGYMVQFATSGEWMVFLKRGRWWARARQLA